MKARLCRRHDLRNLAQLRRPEYSEDFDAIEACIAGERVSAAFGMWLLIDAQVEQLADPDFRAGQASV